MYIEASFCIYFFLYFSFFSHARGALRMQLRLQRRRRRRRNAAAKTELRILVALPASRRKRSALRLV